MPELLRVRGRGAAHQEQGVDTGRTAVVGKASLILGKLSRNFGKHERETRMPFHLLPAVHLTGAECSEEKPPTRLQEKLLLQGSLLLSGPAQVVSRRAAHSPRHLNPSPATLLRRLLSKRFFVLCVTSPLSN